MRRLLAIALLAAAVTGCSGNDPTVEPDVVTPTSVAATADNAATRPDPDFDVGQEIVIDDAGVAPAWLVGLVGLPVTWRNATATRRQLVIEHHPGLGGWIEAGDTFSYTPETLVSFRWHLTGRPRLGGAVEASQEIGGAP